MSETSTTSARHYSAALGWSALVAVATIGTVLAWHRSPYSFGFGDNALFHIAGRWLSQGEVYIRDFIHFRTPGAYYFYALVQQIFGPEFRSTSFALLLETYLFQPVCTALLGLAATKAMFGRASWTVALLCAAAIFVNIPIFQLRTAIPAAALAAYLLSFGEQHTQRTWLVVCGILLGCCYWFGQETFVFLSWTLLCAEFARASGRALLLRRLALLACAVLVSTLPFLIWMAFVGVDLADYFYYTVWFAFVIQPSGMDLPFPPLARDTLSYYWPFLALTLCGGVFALAGQLGRAAVVSLFGFACVRMISALGRSDLLHLGYSISELAVVLPLAVMTLPHLRFDRRRLLLAGITVLLLGVTFIAGMILKSTVLLIIPLALLGMSRLAVAGRIPRPRLRSNAVAGLVGFALMFAMAYPQGWGFARQGYDTFFAKPRDPLGGIQWGQRGRAEISKVSSYMATNRIESIFSYPLSPLYYAFADIHPTRAIYFEPQTRPEELWATMAELAKAPPDLVVQDLGQTTSLSNVLYPLADFITAQYQTVDIIRGVNTIELLRPRERPRHVRRFVDRLYLSNANRSAVSLEILRVGAPLLQTPVLRVTQPASFVFPAGSETELEIMLLSRHADFASEAEVEMRRDRTVTRQRLVSDGKGPVRLQLPGGSGDLEIVLYPGTDGKPAKWVNPMVVGGP